MTGVYTNKAPGGVAYACSFRITEAVYLVERMVDCLADELDMDPAELRMKNLSGPSSSPTRRKTGWVYDSGDYEPTHARWRCDIAGYDELRREQAEKRARGELMGIGISLLHRGRRRRARARTWTSSASAWPTAASCGSTRPARPCCGCPCRRQGQGHETTFAQIVAEELGIPPADIEVVHGDTDQTPFGLGTYGSPVDAGVRARRPRWWPARSATRRRIIASGDARGVGSDDLEWEKGRCSRQGRPGESVDHPGHRDGGARRRELPEGVEGDLDAPDLLQPAEPDLPVRRLHLRRRRRPGHRRR